MLAKRMGIDEIHCLNGKDNWSVVKKTFDDIGLKCQNLGQTEKKCSLVFCYAAGHGIEDEKQIFLINSAKR